MEPRSADNVANPLNNIKVVLVNPIYGANVGAVCRAMKNMGISRLAIAEPRPDLDQAAARQRACHAWEIFERRKEYATLPEAVADCGLVAGTSARRGLYRSHAKSPREWAPRLLAAAAAGRVALVFGPEDKGLSNEHIAACTQIVQIPSSRKYESLNLSHAVMVCCYELFLAAGAFDGAAVEKAPEAAARTRERMFAMWRDTLLAIGFMKEDKADHMMLGLRRILSRGPLTEADVKILMGMARQTQWFVNAYQDLKTRGADGA